MIPRCRCLFFNLLISAIPETRPSVYKEDVYHYVDAHLSPYLSVPDPRSRNHDSSSSSIRQCRLELGRDFAESPGRFDPGTEA